MKKGRNKDISHYTHRIPVDTKLLSQNGESVTRPNQGVNNSV